MTNKYQDILSHLIDLRDAISRDRSAPAERVLIRMGELQMTRPTYKLFNETVDKFWHADQTIFKGFSRKTVLGKVLSLIRETGSPSADGIGQVFKQLLDKHPEETWTVLRPLYGVQFNSSQPLTFGPFTIYHWPTHGDAIKKQMPVEFPHEPSGKYQVGIQVQARENARAYDYADEQFRRFENIICYMMGDRSGRQEARVFEFRSPTHSLALAFSSSTTSSSTRLEGAYLPVDLADSYFTDNNSEHTWIWDTVKNGSPNDIQRRMMKAIDWVGKGVRDPDPSVALTQCIFGLESLLHYDEGVFRPSIVSSLSETCALLAGNTMDDRITVEKLVKELYQKRSATAHEGSDAATDTDVMQAEIIIKSVIHRLVYDPTLKPIQSLRELFEYIHKKKFEIFPRLPM